MPSRHKEGTMNRLNDLSDGKFPIGWSLAVIGALLGASLVVAPRGAAATPAVPLSVQRSYGHDDA